MSARYEDMSRDHFTVHTAEGITFYFHDEREIASANRIRRMRGDADLPEATPPTGLVGGSAGVGYTIEGY